MKKESGPIISGMMSSWGEVLAYAQKRKFPANFCLSSPREWMNYLYYIISGEILISLHGPSGGLISLFVLRKHSTLGLISLFSDYPEGVSWMTLTPCECYVFDKKSILSHAPREVILDLFKQVCTMSAAMGRRFSGSTSKRLEVRLARMLIHLIDSCAPEQSSTGQKMVFTPNLTQRMVSELLGMHHVTLSRIIRQLREEGIIGRFNKSSLEILDIPRLKQYADGLMPPLQY